MGRVHSSRGFLFVTGAALMTAGASGSLAQTGSCELYPIALHSRTIDGLQVGAVIRDVYNGDQPGNFGWLTWTGDGGKQALIAGLTPPGSSALYLNPLDPADTEVSAGDWVAGRPGVEDSSDLRAALDALEGLEIAVPVWDRASGGGSNAAYHVTTFAVIQLLDYRLPRADRITARFLGTGSCATQVPVNLPPVAHDDSYFIFEVERLYLDAPGVLANDRDPEGAPLRATLVSPPLHGTMSLGANGAFFYTPEPTFVGIDTFTYTISDGSQSSNLATGTFYVRTIDPS